MILPHRPYGANSFAELKERTEYEAWLLEAVYEIADHRIAVSAPDEFIYPPGGALPRTVKYASSNIVVGDWRSAFLKVGAPLVFVTAFKTLDMFIEWVLVENGLPSTHRFSEKIKKLTGPVWFPPLIETRPWLRERLCALYKCLEPLRSTVIHDRHFTSAGGSLDVSSTKGGNIGPVVSLSDVDLRNLALTVCSLLRYLQGTWHMDAFEEKRLRFALDKSSHLHGLPSLEQLPPQRLEVQLCVLDADPIELDLARIRSDIAMRFPQKDTVFDVRVAVLSRDGSGATAYLIPWDELNQIQSMSTRSQADLACYAAAIPANLNVAAAVVELNKGDSGDIVRNGT
jgi:hypothetical protein